MQELADGDRIARVSPPGARLLGFILAGFRQQAGVGAGRDPSAGGLQRQREPDR